MALTEDERLLAEAFDTALSSGEKLGLKGHTKVHERENRRELGFENLHTQIDQMYALKANDLTHHTGICAAFAKVHGYKYVDDPTFGVAMEQEMASQGIPVEERRKAVDLVGSVVEQLKREEKTWSEEGSGWHPDLDEIMDQHQEAGL